jgi:phage-related protein
MSEAPLFWVGSALKDLQRFPREVRREMGFALYRAQVGAMHVHAKPLKGFGGAGVIEVVEDLRGDTYRTVYTITLPGAVYVLHAFQKKAKRRSKTPARELDVIRARLKTAREHYDSWQGRR